MMPKFQLALFPTFNELTFSFDAQLIQNINHNPKTIKLVIGVQERNGAYEAVISNINKLELSEEERDEIENIVQKDAVLCRFIRNLNKSSEYNSELIYAHGHK